VTKLGKLESKNNIMQISRKITKWQMKNLNRAVDFSEASKEERSQTSTEKPAPRLKFSSVTLLFLGKSA
jgi:hypothetical protein